ncbi:efflux transporter outer membrane subunit [Burkholderia ubonensis]|uniref:efflux transporter outer membrane subunit n=1 Tax=Burkholderia ubonensis TaxID=101571 RepID=UPI0012F99B0C|nr:efflux transporter outer membrane subunit [Burkholderia ubonensis]
MLLLAGCTVGPDYHAMRAAAPSDWADRPHTAASPTDPKSWWMRFNDSELDHLIGDALCANADVLEAQARLREARASLVQKRSGLYPAIDGSGSATRSRQKISGFGDNSSLTGNIFKTGFDASFELDIFGARRRSVESSAANAQAYEADLDDTIRSLLGDVARHYVQARGYQARIIIAKDTLAARTDTWLLTRAKALAGTGTGLDEVQARAEMDSAAATIAPLEYSFHESVNRLAVLTGAPPQDVLDRLRKAAPVPVPSGEIEPDPPVEVLARRPDVRAAERRIAEATADIGVSEADRYPAVSLAGAIGLNSETIRSFASRSSTTWSFGPTLSVPVFDAGKRAAKVREKEAVRDEKIAAWQATVRSAIEETENALTALDRERAHNEALRKAVAAYKSAFDVSQAQYEAGLTTFLSVLEADRSLASQRDSLAQSDVNLAVGAIALYKALAGGWENDQNITLPERASSMSQHERVSDEHDSN